MIHKTTMKLKCVILFISCVCLSATEAEKSQVIPILIGGNDDLGVIYGSPLNTQPTETPKPEDNTPKKEVEPSPPQPAEPALPPKTESTGFKMPIIPVTFMGIKSMIDQINKEDLKRQTTAYVPTETDSLGSRLFNTMMLFGMVLLLGTGILSLIYRYQLNKFKRAPFEVPSCLELLFPQAVNYETQIELLSAKYKRMI